MPLISPRLTIIQVEAAFEDHMHVTEAAPNGGTAAWSKWPSWQCHSSDATGGS